MPSNGASARTGQVFRRHELVVNHFYDYCSKLVMTATGCLAARTIQHEFRTGKPSSSGASGAYAQMAHADICPLIEDVMEVPEGRHFGIFNVWRSIDPLREIETKPLALCDRTTVSAEDISTKRSPSDNTIPARRIRLTG